MCDVDFGDFNFDSQVGDLWQGLVDYQLVVMLFNQGYGLGIVEMLVCQFGGKVVFVSFGVDGLVLFLGVFVVFFVVDGDDGWLFWLGLVVCLVGFVVVRVVLYFILGDLVDFVIKMVLFVQKVVEKFGVLVCVVLVQVVLEIQWGKYMLQYGDGMFSYNLFGMKVGFNWDGEWISVFMLEVEGGVLVCKCVVFCVYELLVQLFDDYVCLFGDNLCYVQVLGKGDDVVGFVCGLVYGGYVIDLFYVYKIVVIVNSLVMCQVLDVFKNGVGVLIFFE